MGLALQDDRIPLGALPEMLRRWLKPAWTLVILSAVLCYASNYIDRELTLPPMNLRVVWVLYASVFTLCAVPRTPRRRAAAALGCLIGLIGLSGVDGLQDLQSWLNHIADVSVPYAVAELYRWLAGREPLHGNTRTAGLLVVLVGFGGALLHAFAVTFVMYEGSDVPSSHPTDPRMLLVSWFGSLVPVFVLPTVVFSMVKDAFEGVTRRLLIESVFWMLVTAMTGVLTFRVTPASPVLAVAMMLIPVPLVGITSIRTCWGGTGLALGALALVAVSSAQDKVGPWVALGGSLSERLIGMQFYILITGGASLILSGFAVSRRELEKSLRASEAAHKSLIDSAPFLAYAYFVGDDGRRESRLNSARLGEWQRRFGPLSPGLDGDRWVELMHPDDRAIYATTTRRSAISRAPFRHEFRLRDLEGKYRWVRSSLNGLREERGWLWQGLLEDVTADHELADELAASRRQYQNLFDQSNDAKLVLDPETLKVISANLRGAELYGAAAADLVGRNFEDYLAGDSEAKEILRDVARNNSRRTFQSLQRQHTGHVMHTEISAGPVEFQSRTAILVVVRDVTDRFRAEQERVELSSRLVDAQRLNSLSLLAGGVAHDFNNLLLGVMGHASAMQAELDPHSSAYQSLDQILAYGRRGSQLTRQLLTYSGRGGMELLPIDLVSFVEESGDLLRVAAGLQRVVRIEIERTAVQVRADRTQLGQVLLNFVRNAAEAMEHLPGPILVRVRTQVLTTEELSAFLAHEDAKPGEYAVLEVVDQGRGIDPLVRPRIFEPFFTTKSMVMARGIGLAAVLGITRSHGGAVEVQSQLGRGTRFSVYLPLIAAAVSAIPGNDGPRQESEELMVVGGAEEVLVEIKRELKHGNIEILNLSRRGDVLAQARLLSPRGRVVILKGCGNEVADDLVDEIRGIRPAESVMVYEQSPPAGADTEDESSTHGMPTDVSAVIVTRIAAWIRQGSIATTGNQTGAGPTDDPRAGPHNREA